MVIAEFGVGMANNINYLSNFVNKIDGYDGSIKSIKEVNFLAQRNNNINGKVVNLGNTFNALQSYNMIIYGFFTYMITDNEFKILIKNSKKYLKNNGYIYVYDFIVNENNQSKDIHNDKMNIYKRNLNFYLNKFKDFDLIDFRLADNRNLKLYMNNDNPYTIDIDLDKDDYNWTFSALFKLKEDANDR